MEDLDFARQPDPALQLGGAPRTAFADGTSAGSAGTAAATANTSTPVVALNVEEPKARVGGGVAGSGAVQIVATERAAELSASTWYRAALMLALTLQMFVGWLIVSEFFFSLWWHILDPTNLGISYYSIFILFMALAIAPLVFTIAPVTRLLATHAQYLYFVQPAVFLLTLPPSVAWRTAITGVGMFLFLCTFVANFMLSAADLRRQSFRWANPLAVLLVMIWRWDWSGAEPSSVFALWFVKFIICLLAWGGAAFVLYDERVREQWVVFDAHAALAGTGSGTGAGTGAGASGAAGACGGCCDECNFRMCCRPTCQWQWLFRGFEFGSILFLTVWLFDNAAIVCKWALLDPYPNALATIFCFLAGICLDFAYAHYNETHKVITTPFAQYVLSGVLLVTGVALLAHVSTSAKAGIFVGGLLMALALPSLWYQVLHDFKLLRTTHAFGFALPVAGVTMVVLYFGTIANITGGLSPIFGSANGNPIPFLWTPTVLVLLGPAINYLRRALNLDPNWQEHEVAAQHTPPFPYTAGDHDVSRAVAAGGNALAAPPGSKRRPAHAHHHDIHRSEFLLVIGVLLLGVLLPGLIFRGVNRYTADPPIADRLRVMSFNVQQEHTLAGFGNGVLLKEALQDLQPGVVGLQEANALLLLNGNFDLVDYLSSYLHMDSFAGIPTYRSGAGCAALSHYDLERVDAVVMPSLDDCDSCPLPNRMLVRVQFSVNGTRVVLFNTHVEFFSSDAALLQMNYIAAQATPYIAAGMPVIILGDFNIPVNHPSLDPMFALGLTHSAMQHWGLPRNATFPRTEVVDDSHIDHIFYTAPLLRLTNFVINDDDGRVSDHLAVFADFLLV